MAGKTYINNRDNDLSEGLKQLASYLNIPTGVIQAFKSECFVRRYNKGQIIYYSSDQPTYVYLLLDGIVLRETINEDGTLIVSLIKSNYYFR